MTNLNIANRKQIDAVRLAVGRHTKIPPWYNTDIRVIEWLNSELKYTLDPHKALSIQLTPIQASQILDYLNGR